MKVLIINSVYKYGSTGNISYYIAKTVIEDGGQCRVAYGRKKEIDDGIGYKFSSTLGNAFHALLAKMFDKEGLLFTFGTMKLIKFIKEYQPDIINIHNIHGYYVNMKQLLKFLYKYNKPIVWTLHDCWLLTGHCSSFQRKNCYNWQRNCEECSLKPDIKELQLCINAKSNHKIKSELINKLNNVTFVSPSSKYAEFFKQSALKKFPVRVINNGIDLYKFSPKHGDFREKYNLNNKRIILGVSNVWAERKCLSHIIELSKMLSNEFQIILVGLTEGQIKTLPNNIIGLKRTDSFEQLRELYTCADVFINPTLDDNFPTINLEALACGTPVVTYDTGGSGEMLDESCGVVLSEKNAKGLYSGIEKALTLSSENCIKRSKLYNKDVSFMEYLGLFKEISSK